MTNHSYPIHSDEIAVSSASSGSSSASTSSTDVYPLPFSIGQKEIVLNNDERQLVSDASNNNFLTPGTNICVTESTNVDIGNHTIFNEPVTIYQYVQGRTPNGAIVDEVECNKSGQFTDSEQKLTPEKSFPKDIKKLLKDRPTQLWIAGVLLAIMSLASLIVYFSVNFGLAPSASPVAPAPGHTDDLGDGIQVIQRKEWLGRDPLYVVNFTRPPKMVRILHTAGVFCADYQECANKVLGIQGVDVAGKGMPDIAYNYLIGGDGGVYVGRGADVQSDGRNDTLDIAYIGNYLAPYDKMSDQMEESGKKLISRLLEKKKLTQEYIIVAHNQTENSTSPGENIFKKIVHWPHYDSGLYF